MSDFTLTLQRVREIEHRLQTLRPAPNPPGGGEDGFQQALDQATSRYGPSDFDPMIAAAGQKQGVDPDLIKAVIQAESAFNPKAVSPAGAQGLMQLMPGTARSLGVENSFNPAENIDGGTRYLKGLITQYQDLPKAVAAYNAGPGAVDRYGGVPPYRETQQYVSRVLNLYQRYENEGVSQ